MNEDRLERIWAKVRLLFVVKSIDYINLNSHIRDFLSTIIHRIFTLNGLQFLIKSDLKTSKKVFSLELHNSLVRDFCTNFQSLNIDLTRWSISQGSKYFNERKLKTKFIDSSNWLELNNSKIEKFRRRYSLILKKHHGFIISYSLAFVKIFENFRKPMLALNATRYESPFTFDLDLFDSLNNSLKNCFSNKTLMIVSNNLGDKDYLKYYTGIESTYLPSLCDYLPTHSPLNSTWVLFCRNLEISKLITGFSPAIQSNKVLWPTGYVYKELANYKGVIIIPYNISTMQIFELSTAGFPIRIPSDKLLLKWRGLPGILSELSYSQVLKSSILPGNRNSPMDPNWVDFYSWWLERADWNNAGLFPNISRFDCIEELAEDPKPFCLDSIFERNLMIAKSRESILMKFSRLL